MSNIKNSIIKKAIAAKNVTTKSNILIFALDLLIAILNKFYHVSSVVMQNTFIGGIALDLNCSLVYSKSRKSTIFLNPFILD